jgi:hypothetical protein
MGGGGGGGGGGGSLIRSKSEVPVHAIKANGLLEVKPHAFVTSLD